MHKRIEPWQTTLPRVPQMRGSRNRGAPSDAKLVGGEKLATADEESRLTIGNVNEGSMSGREGEVIDMMKRRRIDICCLQETRWTGSGEEEIGGSSSPLYEGATTSVKLRSGESQPFEVKVGVQQESVLSPLLFIVVLEALTRRFRDALPYELLYADDLVSAADSMEELMVKLGKWNESLETKGLR